MMSAQVVSLPLSPGDRLRISILEGDGFAGDYEVDLSGSVSIPNLEPLPVAGLEPDEVEIRLAQALVQAGFFQPDFIRISVQVLELAAVGVRVTGEVFEPGLVIVNSQTPDEIIAAQSTADLPGTFPLGRFLTAALRQAGGIKPTADLTAIRVTRGTTTLVLDVSGILDGDQAVQDIPLIAEDQIHVPPFPIFQNALVQPSAITPGTISVYVSNTILPVNANSPAAVSGFTGFRYGTRLSQAVVQANCAGGTASTNAKRRVALVQTTLLTGASSVLDRPIEDLLRESATDDDNPFLMPSNSLVCYDSNVTNIREVFQTIGDVLSPILLPLDLLID